MSDSKKTISPYLLMADRLYWLLQEHDEETLTYASQIACWFLANATTIHILSSTPRQPRHRDTVGAEHMLVARPIMLKNTNSKQGLHRQTRLYNAIRLS